MWLILLACFDPGPDSGAGDGGAGDGGTGDGGAVLACEGADPTVAGCCFRDQGPLKACATALEPGTVLTGSFSAGEPIDGGVRYRFTWDEGGTPQQTKLYMWIPTFLGSVVPALDTLGTVTLDADGGCDTDGDGAVYGAFVLRDPAGALLLAVGNTAPYTLPEVEVQVDVEPPDGEATCEPYAPADDFCFGTRTNQWLGFTAGGAEVRLLPGDSAPLGDHTVVNVATHTSGDPAGCTDVGGSQRGWLVLPR